MCGWVRERERERERVCVCFHASVLFVVVGLTWDDIERDGLPTPTDAVINLAGSNIMDFKRLEIGRYNNRQTGFAIILLYYLIFLNRTL